jgi:serine/threonine protein kinase
MDGGTTTGGARATRVIADRYELLEPLGRGGMGTVWRATDTLLQRDVAVKEVVFPPGLPDSERDLLRERTRREARSAAGLHHPSAVTVHDVVEHEGAPFIVMELVDAHDLADVVREHGPLSPQRTARVGLEVLGALEAAHRQGIVHRDVKPGNVLLADGHGEPGTGRVVLTDFGIATSTGDSSITSTGLILGSPSYIAPERARGEQPGPASDLWSLGATLFTAVEGRPPFDAGDALATVTAVVMGERAPFVAAGPLAPVLDGLLERDPDQRLRAADARRLLEQVAHDDSASAVTAAPVAVVEGRESTAVLPVGRSVRERPAPAPIPRPARPSTRPTRALPLALAAVVLAAAAVGVGALVLDQDDDGSRTAAPSPSPSASASAPTPTPTPTTQASPTEPASAAQGPVAPPEGWRTETGGPGWTLAVPPSWQAGSFGDTPEWRDPATGRTVRVSSTGPGGGKADAVQDRRDQAASFATRHGDYREIAIAPIDYRGYEAADWEFTYTDGGVGLHALSRVFVVDGRGYSLFFQTRAGDDWNAARADFETISAAFRPA